FIYQHLDWPAGLPQPGVGQGMLLGIGALTGDAMESFFKRRRGIKSGSSWYPFDQIDYIIGGLIFALLFIKPTLSLILWVGLVYFGLHLVFSYLGYLLGLKKHPL
ncbi:MAG TPA: CDP-archaeol synthase, partial [Patescibacteria group bacterium]|nr:CDP-archaeol synthase [Patescibacteria group bacterium]